MFLFELLAQANQNPLMGLPAPEGASWWPIAMAIISMLVAGISAGFAAWVKLSEKTIDNDVKTETARASFRIKQLEVDADNRKVVFETLQQQNQMIMQQNTQLIAHNAKLIEENEKLKETISAMRKRITELEAKSTK